MAKVAHDLAAAIGADAHDRDRLAFHVIARS
jgi:hypothetical protein